MRVRGKEDRALSERLLSLATEKQAAAGRGRGSKEAVLKWSCSLVVLGWSLEK